MSKPNVEVTPEALPAATTEAAAAPTPTWFKLDSRLHPLTHERNLPLAVSLTALPEGIVISLRLVGPLLLPGVSLSVGQFPAGLVPAFDRIELIVQRAISKIQHELKDVVDVAFR